MASISIDKLANEITKAIQEYTLEVEEKVELAKEEVTKDAVKKLKNKSRKKTGEYAKGWARKKIGKNIVIYNKNKPQLTHLLEHGHVKRGGGRAKAFPHIRPVEEETVEKFEKQVEKAIKR